MSQNVQTFGPDTRLIDRVGFTPEHLPAAAVSMEEADWEIEEFDAADEAEFEELTKFFVPFEPDFD